MLFKGTASIERRLYRRANGGRLYLGRPRVNSNYIGPCV
jgi:hypothetical protein